MSKPSAKIVQGLLKFHFNHNPARFSSFSEPLVNARGFSFRISNGFSNSAKTHIHPNFQSSFAKPTFSNGRLTPNLSSFSSFFGNFKLGGGGSACKSLGFGRLYFDPLRVRCFSTKVSGFGSKLNSGLGKKVFEKPLSAVGTRFSRYREAVGLQIEGFFKRNYLFLVGAGAVFMCILLWRVMFGIANAFVGLSEGMAKYGFLALSSAMVAFAGIYLRSRYTINPDKVYRMAMRELNTSAGILEVMGTPLTGTDLRAYVMSGGGLALRKFSPKLRSKRCFLIFPIRGSEKRGLVSVEVKKKKGQYDMKLLAVDIPMASGPDQRLFLIGDEEEYRIGGGLITELREPVIKAMAATKEFEEMDEIEEEEDAARELQKAQQKQQEEIAALERERAR